MESLDSSEFAVVGCMVKKKRSSVSRRPRLISQAIIRSYWFLSSSPVRAKGSASNEDQNFSNDYNGLGSENKLKLKIKLGGVNRTIQTKAEHAFGRVLAVAESSHCSDALQTPEKSTFQENKNSSCSNDKGKDYRVQWKEHTSRGKATGVGVSMNETGKYEPIRKSKRVPKRCVLDVGFNRDDDDDEEIRYLGRLNGMNASTNYDYKEDERNERDHGIYEEKDYVEEEKPVLKDMSGCKKRKLGKGSVDLFLGRRNESTPSRRNQPLLSWKDVSYGSGSCLIELPDGLPPAPPKRQKEKLSEVEQQLKKDEAARRRRMQSEKAAEEAIRKILGQDSSRKKREEKLKKRQDELSQGKAAKFDTLASNTIRWVIGSTGTTVTFSEDIGLPNIFRSGPCSYPPPREICAGPNCTNIYKYRDSKSKLPLCSLHCYKAVHGKMQPTIAC